MYVIVNNKVSGQNNAKDSSEISNASPRTPPQNVVAEAISEPGQAQSQPPQGGKRKAADRAVVIGACLKSLPESGQRQPCQPHWHAVRSFWGDDG